MTEYLKVTNCRGKKAVLRDIVKSIKLIDQLFRECNYSQGKKKLNKSRNLLYDIIHKEDFIIVLIINLKKIKMGRYLGLPFFKGHVTNLSKLLIALEKRETLTGSKQALTKSQNEKVDIVINKINECIDILQKIK